MEEHSEDIEKKESDKSDFTPIDDGVTSDKVEEEKSEEIKEKASQSEQPQLPSDQPDFVPTLVGISSDKPSDLSSEALAKDDKPTEAPQEEVSQPSTPEVTSEEPSQEEKDIPSPEEKEEVPEPPVESPEPPAEEVKPEAPPRPKGQWYIIQTLTGYEERVKSSIERTVRSAELEDRVFQVLIPEEEVIEIKEGKRTEKMKKMYPGYVFIEMLLDEDTWYAIRKTSGVARFIGSKVKPTPVSEREMQRVLKQIGIKEEKIEVAFEKGESVRVISGPFRGYAGKIDDLNLSKEKMRVLINIFGRETPVEINFEQAEKII